MSAPSSPNFARVLELLADQSTGALSTQDQLELDSLMAGLSDQERASALVEQDRLQNAAAEALALMMSRDRSSQVSASLRDRLLASGMAEIGGAAGPAPASPARATAGAAPRPLNLPAIFGWFAAAAAITFAVVMYQNRPQALVTPPTPSIFALRDELLQKPGTVKAAWTPVAAKEIAGEVAWNQDLQTGYLRLKGLPENDPAKSQYQLWIFDKGRIEPQHAGDILKQNPIDGGVFDITTAQKDPATGDYIVRINAKLKVFDPAAFAVTSERPGGVVVTTRETLQALAPLGG